ncbi:MAG: hypothetical protein ACTSWT_11525 [Candidatus Heimdallarchaeota archaeon]
MHVIEISSHSEGLQLYYNLGLHDGEISLLLAAKKEDVIVFDDLVARAVARAEGFSLTDLLGLLVSLKKAKKLSQKQALSILSAKIKTNFIILEQLLPQGSEGIVNKLVLTVWFSFLLLLV